MESLTNAQNGGGAAGSAERRILGDTMAETAKKKEDLGQWEDPGKTYEERRAHRDNLLAAIQAIDESYNLAVQQRLQEKTGSSTPDWRVLDESHEKFDKGLADEVRSMVDQYYDVTNKFHPLRDMLKDKGLADGSNYFMKSFLNDLLTKFRGDLKKAVGSSRFYEHLQGIQSANTRVIGNETIEHTVADIDSNEKRAHVAKYLKKRHDVAAVESDEMLTRYAQDAMREHMTGELDQRKVLDYGRKAGRPEAAGRYYR